MQNFMEIGPVVFAGECVSIKIGCSSYNTSEPVKSLLLKTTIIIIIMLRAGMGVETLLNFIVIGCKTLVWAIFIIG